MFSSHAERVKKQRGESDTNNETVIHFRLKTFNGSESENSGLVNGREHYAASIGCRISKGSKSFSLAALPYLQVGNVCRSSAVHEGAPNAASKKVIGRDIFERQANNERGGAKR